jgi:7-cyano-7-deazaguanine synthase
MKDKVVVLLSGGLDSCVLLSRLVAAEQDVFPMSVRYGQRHAHREIRAALDICQAFGLEQRHIVAELPHWLFAGSALTGSGPIPEGRYDDESMRSTVVPNRNMVFIALATAYAISIGARKVAYAAHAGDHAIYPDCRPDFFAHMSRAVLRGSDGTVLLFAPFIDATKADIVRIGATFRAPMQLSYSCYKGGTKHCGVCGTCVERREAFNLAGVPDLTEYADGTLQTP